MGGFYCDNACDMTVIIIKHGKLCKCIIVVFVWLLLMKTLRCSICMVTCHKNTK